MDFGWAIVAILLVANALGRWFVASMLYGGGWLALVLWTESIGYGAGHAPWEFLVPLFLLLVGGYGYFKKAKAKRMRR